MIEDALATYRVARLVTQDTIFDGPRNRIWEWAKDHDRPKVAELIVCPYCVGVWAAGVVVVLGFVPGGRLLRRVLAVAGAAALAQQTVEYLDMKGRA